MFVPHARVRLTGMPAPGRRRGKGRRRRAARRKLKLREHLRMPCLLPTCASCLLGLLVLLGGTGMSLIGYHPMFSEHGETVSNITSTVTTTEKPLVLPYTFYRNPGIKALSYIGPIFMGCGLFVMIVAGVLYCEIIDKYVTIEQEKTMNLPKDELYDIIIHELRKNYFRGIEVPLPDPHGHGNIRMSIKRTLFKALSISTPALLLTPEITRRWQKRNNMLTMKQQEEAQEQIKLKLFPKQESWVKTSSLPNIPKDDLAKEENLSEEDEVSSSYLEKKRISRSCGNVTDIFEEGENHLTSSCFDNPAYIPDMDKNKAIALVREHCKRLVAGTGSKCSVRWEDERESDVNLCARFPLATKEELRLFDSCDEDKLCVGSVSSLKEVQKHPLQSSSFEVEECNGDSDVEASRVKHSDRHVSVIVHKASVHQPDDRADSSCMQKLFTDQPPSESDPKSGQLGVARVVLYRSHSDAGSEQGRLRPPLLHSRRISLPEDDKDPCPLPDFLHHHVDTSRVTYL